MRTAWIILGAALLSVVPASAGLVYDNGPVNATITGWNITPDTVSDSFTVSSATTITSVNFWVWNTAGDITSAVDWSIGTTTYGTDVGSGTGAAVSSLFDFTNSFGYDINELTISGLSVPVAPGTYWLSLLNAVAPNGDSVFWDENDGPSLAFDSAIGELSCGASDCSETFQVLDSSVPEPGSMILLGSGLLLVGALRRRMASTRS